MGNLLPGSGCVMAVVYEEEYPFAKKDGRHIGIVLSVMILTYL